MGRPATEMVVSRTEVRTDRGTVGYRRRVSFMIALRIGRASISADEGAVGVERGGRAVRISSRRRTCQAGWVASR